MSVQKVLSWHTTWAGRWNSRQKIAPPLCLVEKSRFLPTKRIEYPLYNKRSINFKMKWEWSIRSTLPPKKLLEIFNKTSQKTTTPRMPAQSLENWTVATALCVVDPARHGWILPGLSPCRAASCMVSNDQFGEMSKVRCGHDINHKGHFF